MADTRIELEPAHVHFISFCPTDMWVSVRLWVLIVQFPFQLPNQPLSHWIHLHAHLFVDCSHPLNLFWLRLIFVHQNMHKFQQMENTNLITHSLTFSRSFVSFVLFVSFIHSFIHSEQVVCMWFCTNAMGTQAQNPWNGCGKEIPECAQFYDNLLCGFLSCSYSFSPSLALAFARHSHPRKVPLKYQH